MKSLFLIHCLILLSPMASSQQYKLKVTNTRNNHSYFIKPGQNFRVIFDTSDFSFEKFTFDSVDTNGIIHASFEDHNLKTTDTTFGIHEIYKLKVQPRNLFKTITKSTLTILLLLPIPYVFDYGTSTIPIGLQNLAIVTLAGFAIIAPQTAYGIPERVWLRLDKRLVRGRSLKIEAVPAQP